MEKENAINFLLFSYFAITLDDGDKEDAIISAAIDRAYRDAFSHVFSLSDEYVKYNTRKDVSEEIKNKIKELLNQNPPEYLEWHTKICSNIVKSYCTVAGKGDRELTYGIAQKWINMSMKYLCVIKSVFAQCNQIVLENLSDELENEMHVPIDGYILESIKRSEDDLQTDIISWSKWTTTDGEWKSSKDEYHILQEKIRAACEDDTYNGKSNNLLDWEGSEWIKIAKKKRKDEKEKQAKKMDDNKK